MSIFKRRATTENYKEFRRVFGQIRKISTQGTMQEERRGELEAEDGEEEYFGELPPYKVGS